MKKMIMMVTAALMLAAAVPAFAAEAQDGQGGAGNNAPYCWQNGQGCQGPNSQNCPNGQGCGGHHGCRR